MVEPSQSARDAAEEWGGIVNHRDSEYEGDAVADLALAFAAAEQRGAERQRERDAALVKALDMNGTGELLAQAIRQEPTT